jgi:hypothetical protein
MRLLYCKTCATLEEVPELGRELKSGEVDPLVEGLVLKHTARDPMGHGDSHLQASPFRLAAVEDDEWQNDRERVIKLLNSENKKVGFDAWVYEATNTYAEDALRCYSDHHRPKEGCIDYWDESKRIGRPTAEGRAVLAEEYKLGQSDPHLCQYCPVQTYVTTQVNFKQGLYKK